MKTSGKKTNRRLKKTVRRTLGGLLLASSIIVAAIPFPDAEAYDPATAAVPAYDVTSADYVYTYSDLGNYSTDTDFKSMSTGEINKALIMYKTKSGSWQLDWQFEYWLPSVGSNGYITGYNSQYSVVEIILSSRVFSDYVFLTQADVEEFYNNTTDEFIDIDIHYGDVSTKNVTDIRTVRYPYAIYDKYDPTREIDQWIMSNFPEDYSKYRTAYDNYENNMTVDGSGNLVPDPNYPKPDPLIRTVGDKYKTDAERVQFLCESVFGDGTPSMELVNVDKRTYSSTGEASWEKVFVPNVGYAPSSGTLAINGHSYYVDNSYFLCDTFATIVGVGKDAFKGVNNVDTLEMEKEISFIGDSAFEDSFVKEAKLSSDAKIGNKAFYNCTKLYSVELPEGIRRVGAEAFYGCPIVDLVIPDSCTYIGPGAFANSASLSTVTFASNGSTSQKQIMKYAFYDDLNLQSVDFKSCRISEIGDAAFAINNVETGNGMLDFTFPAYISKDSSGKTNIGEYCLAGRGALKTVTFPDNLDGKLDDTIFYLCSGLESVTFGEKCRNMTYDSSTSPNTMFYSVTNPNFYVRGPKLNDAGSVSSPRKSTWIAMYDYTATGNVGRHVPYVYSENGKDYYEVSDGNYLMVIEKDTGELVSCSFPTNVTPTPIDTFTIPAVVGNTPVSGLKDGCLVGDTVNVGVLDYIVNLVIEDGSSIKNIDDDTFKNADCLETVYLGDSVESIGKGAFEDCPVLEEVTIGEGINSIGDNAFQNSPKLENITFKSPADLSSFPEGSIGENAFNTKGNKLTLHGEIGTGYAPFEWATDKENYANKNQSIRALYKSPMPSGLTVILDNQNELPTLVDYPHYEYLDRVAYDIDDDCLVQLDTVPTATEPYYNQTIMDKIKRGDSLNYLEETMVKNCLNIVIPEGIESIDSEGFFNSSSKQFPNIEPYSNAASVAAYFNRTSLPFSSYADEGLFSGYYGDGTIIDSSDANIREFDNGDYREKRAKGNDRIVSVTMNDVRYLPDNAFDSCESLETVFLGNKIDDVGELPFSDCESMSSIACSNGKFECVNGLLYENTKDVAGNDTKKIIECLESRGDVVGDTTISLDNDPDLANVTDIADSAFANCENIDEIDLEGVKFTKLPDKCFEGCVKLADITLPEEIDEIGDECFANIAEKARVTAYNRNMVLGNDSKKNVSEVKYITYEDAPARIYAKKQNYDVSKTLDNSWTITYICNECIHAGTGASKITKEIIEDGEKAHGIDEDDRLAHIEQYHPDMEFDKYSDSLRDIHENKTIYMILKSKSQNPDISPNVTPGSNPNVTPGSNPNTTPGGNNSNPQNNPNPTGGASNNDNSKKYKLLVNYGSGSGDYAADTTVIIEAIDAPKGKVFDKWTVSSNGSATPTIYSTTSKATTLKMPAGDCIITATYKDEGSSSAASRTSTGGSGRNGTAGGNSNNNNKGSGTFVDIVKPGISNVDKAYASVNGSKDNFIVKISESSDAANLVATALAAKYGDMTPIKYFAMDISLYDATGTNKITDTAGMSVNITMPIPDALVQYAGNNRVGAVNGTTLEDLNCKFVTVEGIPCISFTASHFSPYTIYVDTNNITYGTMDSTPKTGDGIHPKWFASISLFCGSMILFFKKDRRSKRVKTA